MATTYCPGTVINCNRCDKRFTLEQPRAGYSLHTTAARLLDFERCPHCETRDTHWVYAANNLALMELTWQVQLCEFVFAEPDQARHAHVYLSAQNIFTRLVKTNTLIARDAQDVEAAIHALRAYETKRTAPCHI